MTLNELILLLAVGLVFAPLEWLRPIRKVPADWRRLRTDAYVFVSGSLIRWGGAAAAVAIAMVVAAVAPGGLGGAVRSQPGWLQFIELLLVSDLVFYGAHRLFHAVPFLWRFHEVHHSSEKLDWIATNRVHPVDQIINSAIIAAPALILGFAPGPMLVYALVYRFHGAWLHSNVSSDLGPLGWLVATPKYHHWHHADQLDAYDRNFGGQLLIFDRLFGTLNLPPGRMPQKYGLSDPIPATYLGQLMHPFRRPGPGGEAAAPYARAASAETARSLTAL